VKFKASAVHIAQPGPLFAPNGTQLASKMDALLGRFLPRLGPPNRAAPLYCCHDYLQPRKGIERARQYLAIVDRLQFQLAEGHLPDDVATLVEEARKAL
jgi:hypothetical protein